MLTDLSGHVVMEERRLRERVQNTEYSHERYREDTVIILDREGHMSKNV